MWKISLSYFPWQNNIGFLVLKQDVVNLPIWQISFKVHALFTGLILLAGYTQFSKTVRRKFPKQHRQFGYIYILVLLTISAPSGLVLAFFASGGLATKICFMLFGILWVFTTLKALFTAKQKNFVAHREWMIRSYALSLSALSLRTWKLILYELSPYIDYLTPYHIYQIEAWLGFGINLIIAECWIRYTKPSTSHSLY